MEFKGKQTRFSQPKTLSFFSAMVWPNSPKKFRFANPFSPINRFLRLLCDTAGERKPLPKPRIKRVFFPLFSQSLIL